MAATPTTTDVAVSPDGSTAYAQTGTGYPTVVNSFERIDLTTQAVSTFTVPRSVGNVSQISTLGQKLAILPDGTTAFVQTTGTIDGHSHAVLLKISLSDGSILNVRDLGLGSGGMTPPVLSKDGSTVYAAVQSGGVKSDTAILFALNADSLAITATHAFPGSDTPSILAHTAPDSPQTIGLADLAVGGNGVYAESFASDPGSATTGKLFSFDPVTLAQTATVDLGSNLGELATAGTKVFVGGDYSGKVEVFDTPAGSATTVSQTITGLGSAVSDLAVSQDGSKLYVNVNGNVKSVDVATGKVISSLTASGLNYWMNVTLNPAGTILFTITSAGTLEAYSTNAA